MENQFCRDNFCRQLRATAQYYAYAREYFERGDLANASYWQMQAAVNSKKNRKYLFQLIKG